jgi:hypothetical protein
MKRCKDAFKIHAEANDRVGKDIKRGWFENVLKQIGWDYDKNVVALPFIFN